MRRKAHVLSLLAVSSAACNVPVRDSFDSFSTDSIVDHSSTAASGPTSGDDEADADETGTKLDLPGPGMNSGGDASGGCQKIDFLFIIDNSGSMQEEQANLIASFPGFMSTITETLEAGFFHVMAISTDNGEGGSTIVSCSNGSCDCTPAPLCCEHSCGASMLPSTSCNGFDCNDLPITECDRSWGAGKVHSSDGMECGIEGDRRYMLHTQPDLAGSFACSASVGLYGSGAEKPMLALNNALSDDLNGSGACNQGFLRKDAILVVTLITDEEDDNTDAEAPGSPGNPPEWIEALVEAKGGNPEAVVFLALVGDNNLPGATCAAGVAEAAPRLQAVAQGLPFGVVGSVCAPDYTPFFAAAVSVIDASCTIFEPEG